MKTNALPVVVYFNYVENKASYRGLLTKNKLRFSFMFCGRRLKQFSFKRHPNKCSLLSKLNYRKNFRNVVGKF